MGISSLRDGKNMVFKDRPVRDDESLAHKFICG